LSFFDIVGISAEGGAALSNMLFCPSELRIHIFSGDRAQARSITVIGKHLGQ